MTTLVTSAISASTSWSEGMMIGGLFGVAAVVCRTLTLAAVSIGFVVILVVVGGIVDGLAGALAV